ncbi:MAG TPA: 1-phosphofructokinase, partial [Firmicutes bacterium]|nr:1-phosphofructokinase [Bacillota bacterium]
VVNTVGCGDAFVAGWMAARVGGLSAEEQLREALSVAAANAMTSGAGIIEGEHAEQMRKIAVVERIRG